MASLFFLGMFYRSASLYHPQRRAILHLKDMSKKKGKDKNKIENKPPYFDFSTLRLRSLQVILVSTSLTSFGAYSPLIYFVSLMMLQFVISNLVWESIALFFHSHVIFNDSSLYALNVRTISITGSYGGCRGPGWSSDNASNLYWSRHDGRIYWFWLYCCVSFQAMCHLETVPPTDLYFWCWWELAIPAE